MSDFYRTTMLHIVMTALALCAGHAHASTSSDYEINPCLLGGMGGNSGFADIYSTLTTTGGQGGKRSSEDYVTIPNPVPIQSLPPTAEFSADTTSGCAPMTVEFQDLSDNNPTYWAWDFDGDGEIESTSQTPAPYVYAVPGIYTVVLSVTNDYGSHTESKPDYITVGEPPVAPTNVQASAGAYPDRVHVAWTAVPGATEYSVYRTSAAGTSGTLLAQVTGVAYDDTTAAPSSTIGGWGCLPQYQISVSYNYQVTASNACGKSGLSSSAAGWRGAGAESAFASERVHEEVLPAKMFDDSLREAKVDSVLCVRLRSDEPIDPNSIWGLVTCAQFESDLIAWLPIDDGNHDGWVVYQPVSPWTPGDVVTMTAGGNTVSGAPVAVVTYGFRIKGQNETSDADCGEAIWQPTDLDLDSGGLTLDAESQEIVVTTPSDETLPLLAEGIGLIYQIGPQQAYAMPQRAWLPVPDTVPADDVAIYYYYGTGSHPGWYPAQRVEGWFVPGSVLRIELDGTVYLGFLVRHSGILQLGVPQRRDTLRPATASASTLGLGYDGSFGDLLFMGCLLIPLWVGGRRAAKALNRPSLTGRTSSHSRSPTSVDSAMMRTSATREVAIVHVRIE